MDFSLIHDIRDSDGMRVPAARRPACGFATVRAC
jgi:hypothetical protein